MIAAAAATTMTHPMDSDPWEAMTAHAINAVSPGSGRPNDSSASSANMTRSAQSRWSSTKPWIDPRGTGE